MANKSVAFTELICLIVLWQEQEAFGQRDSWLSVVRFAFSCFFPEFPAADEREASLHSRATIQQENHLKFIDLKQKKINSEFGYPPLIKKNNVKGVKVERLLTFCPRILA